MKKVIIALCFMFVASFSFADDNQVEKDLKEVLKKQYPGNYTIQLSLFNTNMKAYHESKTIDRSGDLGTFFDERVKRYYPKYAMIMRLYNANIKAKKAME